MFKKLTYFQGLQKVSIWHLVSGKPLSTSIINQRINEFLEVVFVETVSSSIKIYFYNARIYLKEQKMHILIEAILIFKATKYVATVCGSW